MDVQQRESYRVLRRRIDMARQVFLQVPSDFHLHSHSLYIPVLKGPVRTLIMECQKSGAPAPQCAAAGGDPQDVFLVGSLIH